MFFSLRRMKCDLILDPFWFKECSGGRLYLKFDIRMTCKIYSSVAVSARFNILSA